MNLAPATIPILVMLASCVGTDVPSRELLRDRLVNCAKDESCYIKSGEDRSQAILLQKSVVQNAIALCVQEENAMTLLPSEHKSKSHIIFADCARNGEKEAQVSAWYYHGEIRDLTLEICGDGRCNGRFSPI